MATVCEAIVFVGCVVKASRVAAPNVTAKARSCGGSAALAALRV